MSFFRGSTVLEQILGLTIKHHLEVERLVVAELGEVVHGHDQRELEDRELPEGGNCGTLGRQGGGSGEGAGCQERVGVVQVAHRDNLNTKRASGKNQHSPLDPPPPPLNNFS